MNFVDQMEAEIKLINELKDKTMILWNRLDVSAEEREQILMAVTKPCGKTVRNLVSKFLVFRVINFPRVAFYQPCMCNSGPKNWNDVKN